MKRYGPGFAATLLLAVACSPGSGAPASGPSPSTTTEAAPRATAAVVASPRPGGASPEAQTKPGGQEWDRVLADARREGVVAVVSHPDLRAVLTEPFERAYGIRVEYLAGQGREVSVRVGTERRAGQFDWDVLVHGTTTALESFVPTASLDPLEPALLLPDVKDPQKWRGGALEFVDPGRTILVMTPFQRGSLFVNPNLVDPGKFTSYKDLLAPEWRGKIVMDDPRTPGPAQATFTFFYLHPDLGPDFIRALGKQDVTILRDFRQELDAIGQGTHLVLIGTPDLVAEARRRQGVPVEILNPRLLKEGSDVSPANGALALFNRAPHPNAARVFINWLLSREGQTEFVQATGYVSSRLDAPTDHALPWRVPLPGAIKTYDLPAMAVKDKLIAVLQETFGD